MTFDKLIKDYHKREQSKSRFASNAKTYTEYRNTRRSDLWAFIAAEFNASGPFKVQWFDREGLSGHSVCSSIQSAAELMFREGYSIPDKDAYKRQWNI